MKSFSSDRWDSYTLPLGIFPNTDADADHHLAREPSDRSLLCAVAVVGCRLELPEPGGLSVSGLSGVWGWVRSLVHTTHTLPCPLHLLPGSHMAAITIRISIPLLACPVLSCLVWDP